MPLARQIELHHLRGDLEWLEFMLPGPVDTAERLRVEVAPRDDLIRCCAGGATKLWARLERYQQGVTVFSAVGSESPGVLPPWPFADVREAGGGSDEAWLRRITDALLEAPRSPLSRGSFGIARTRWDGHQYVPNRDCHVAYVRGLDDPAFYPRLGEPHRISWSTPFDGTVHPLRQRPDDEEGRLKAWRKAAREGWLPPLVLFRVSGLNAWLLIDGHLRLRAAQLEQVRPRVVLVWRLIEEVYFNDGWTATVLRRYEHAGKRWSEIRPDLRIDLNQQLVDCFIAMNHRPRSAAIVRPGLRELFEQETRER